MARLVNTAEEANYSERVKKCNHCNSLVAYTHREVFLDLSYGKEHNGEESVTCPNCKKPFHIGSFQACERM